MCRTQYKCNAFFMGLASWRGTAKLDLSAGLLGLFIVLGELAFHLSFKKISQVILSYFLLIFELTTTKKGKYLKVKVPKNSLLKWYLSILLCLKLHPISPCHSQSSLLLILSIALMTILDTQEFSYFIIICLYHSDRSYWSQGLLSALPTGESQQVELCLHIASTQQALVEAIDSENL